MLGQTRTIKRYVTIRLWIPWEGSDMILQHKSVSQTANKNDKVEGTVTTIVPSLTLTLFDMGFLERSVMGGGGIRATHHSFAVIAPMIMKFGTGIKLDVFYTMVTK